MTVELRRVAAGVRAGGIGWLGRTLRNELRNPRRAPTFALRRAAAWLARIGAAPEPELGETLVFFLDLAAAPVTFDIASYLVGAELARRRAGLRDIFVVVVPGPESGFRREEAGYADLVDLDARRWRLRHVILPALSLLPSVSGHIVCRDRRQAAALQRAARRIYPDTYTVGLPRQPAGRDVRDAARRGEQVWPLLEAEAEPRRMVAGFLAEIGAERPVVISLRQYGYMSGRNSHLATWAAFADELRHGGYTPVFVPDTSAGLVRQSELGDHLVFAPAAWNLSLRMALYEAAWLNMAVMHGPMELCWYSERCRYLIFIPVGAAPQCTPESLEEQGHEIGRDFRFAGRFQRLVWEAETLPTVRNGFAELAAAIEAQSSSNASL